MTAETGATSTYQLGHTDEEIQRLLLQAKLYDRHTENGLRAAGLREGMSVLDVGCGPGDVSLAAARLVGPTGTVLGVDAKPEILELARDRAAESAVSTVSFETAIIPDIPRPGPFDAVIGRLILMHLPDPVGALRRLATLVRPGGLIVFQEFDISQMRSIPEMPQFTTFSELLVRAFRGAGLDTEFGTRLYTLFKEAGLAAPSMAIGSPVGGSTELDLFAYLVAAWRLMFPTAHKLGIVTDEVTDFDALRTRIHDEAATADTIITGPSLVSAWTTVS